MTLKGIVKLTYLNDEKTAAVVVADVAIVMEC